MVSLLLGLGGCASTIDDENTGASVEPVTRFVGTLPCDDCRVIRADLTLHRDPESGLPEKYFLQQTHVDAVGGDFTSTLWGDWRLMPTDEEMYYRIEGLPKPIILRVEEEGQRLGWGGVRDPRDMESFHELTRAEPLR